GTLLASIAFCRSLSLANEVPIPLRPVLDHAGDCAACVLDELHTGSLHGEVVFRVRDERDLSRSWIDHESASFQGDHCAKCAAFVRTGVLSKDLGRNTKLLPSLPYQVWRIALVFTDILNQVPVRDQIELDRERPRLAVRLGIVERHLEIEMAKIAAAVTLGHAQ